MQNNMYKTLDSLFLLHKQIGYPTLHYNDAVIIVSMTDSPTNRSPLTDLHHVKHILSFICQDIINQLASSTNISAQLLEKVENGSITSLNRIARRSFQPIVGQPKHASPTAGHNGVIISPLTQQKQLSRGCFVSPASAPSSPQAGAGTDSI
jgi:hypothetical protein